MDKSELALKLLEWEERRRVLDALEEEIKTAVLELGQSQQVGNVKAAYSGGRKQYDYEAVGADAPPSMVAAYTKTTEKVYWRDLVLEGLGVDQAEIPYSQSDPSVSLRLT